MVSLTPCKVLWGSRETAWEDDFMDNEQRGKLRHIDKFPQKSHRWNPCLPSLKPSWVNPVNNWGFDQLFSFYSSAGHFQRGYDTVMQLSPLHVTQMSSNVVWARDLFSDKERWNIFQTRCLFSSLWWLYIIQCFPRHIVIYHLVFHAWDVVRGVSDVM